jgi:hypothetical protein
MHVIMFTCIFGRFITSITNAINRCEYISLNYKRKSFYDLNRVANKLLRPHSQDLHGLHHNVRHHSLNPIMMKLVIDE